jgi:hypothetical protein
VPVKTVSEILFFSHFTIKSQNLHKKFPASLLAYCCLGLIPRGGRRHGGNSIFGHRSIRDW